MHHTRFRSLSRKIVDASVIAAIAAVVAAVVPQGSGTPVALAGSAAASAPGVTEATTRLSQLLTTQISDLASRTSATDTNWYANGVWTAPPAVTSCWRCLMGPGVAAATASAVTESGSSTPLRAMAINTIDHVIATYKLPSGAFGLPGSISGSEVDTTFTASQIAQAYVSLAPFLDPGRKAVWTAAVADAADYLVANGNLQWYTNGNINLGNATVMAGAYALTHLQRYADYTATALDFALSPPQDRWPGLGFVYTTVPTKPDGSDGAGYFTETGLGGTGYDPDYTQIQADFAARLYQFTGDQRSMRIVNMLVNQLLLRTSTANWHLDTSGGTRHTGIDWRFMITPALAVAAWQGNRAALQPLALSQLSAVETNYAATFQYDGPNAWAGLASQPAVELLAVTHLQPGTLLPPPTPPTPTPTPTSSGGAPATPSPTPTLTPTPTASPSPTPPLANAPALWFWTSATSLTDGQQLIMKAVVQHVPVYGGVHIVLQKQGAYGWQEVLTGVSDVNGLVKFALTPHTTETYRVVTIAMPTLPAMASDLVQHVAVLPKVVLSARS